MKWYFASRTKHREQINKISNFLKTNHHTIAYEWSKLTDLEPYHQNAEKSSLVAEEISQALKNVDVFVLISDIAGTDMFIELGFMLGQLDNNSNPRIYAIGEHNNRSLMHFHPAIIKVDKLSQVLNRECPELLEKINEEELNNF